MAATRFSEAYPDIVAGLASKNFSADKDWQALLTRARKLTGALGFEVGEAGLTDDLRKKIQKADAKGSTEAEQWLDAAGVKASGPGAATLINGDTAKQLGALKTLRHTYLVKRFGGHKVWILAIPTSFTDWPCSALAGDLATVKTRLNDSAERFSHAQRKDLKDASQEALKWVHKAMSASSHMKSKTNFERVARWFADGSSKDADVLAAAAKLNAGFKKIASQLKSGHLIYTDSVSERGTNANVGTEAFVWGDPMDVVYIEEEFFGSRNTLTGLTNWARIVVHELTHREVKTADHAYEHQGINPSKLTAGKAIENADSWAWYAADCAGALIPSVIKNALDR